MTMNRHGSESYFVIGEGLLGESVGGRERTLAATLEAETAPFRFSRMGPSGINHQLSDGALARLAQAVGAGGGAESKIPAGFTYLGQFVDHDLSFDKTAVMLGENVSATELLQARSPSLDLDSLYGAGPDDPGSEKFYEDDGIHLRMGKTVAVDFAPTTLEGFDLPRGAGSTVNAKRRAIIPDPRNDENLAVAQTHLAMIRFHNRVVDTLPNSVPMAKRFQRARGIVTRHYQWMLRTDYLPRICAPGVVNDVFSNGRKAFEVGVTPTDVPTMPIEFSVAAFRLGHSMIRRAYNWNRTFDDGTGTLEYLFIFSAGSGDLDGLLRLATSWVADFRRLYDFSEAGRDDLVVPDANFAMRIDTRLALPLRNLPKLPADENDLALRNFKRAKMVRLATGQQMATFLKSKGVTLTKLTADQIREGKNGATLEGLTQTQRVNLVKDTPLWFYVLREAEVNQGRLKGVGARVVAETFHRAMEGSQISIVRHPTWRPKLGPNNTTFRMVDLLLFAFQGKKNLLAPLAD
jgi:Animal haem peroxidase